MNCQAVILTLGSLLTGLVEVRPRKAGHNSEAHIDIHYDILQYFSMRFAGSSEVLQNLLARTSGYWKRRADCCSRLRERSLWSAPAWIGKAPLTEPKRVSVACCSISTRNKALERAASPGVA